MNTLTNPTALHATWLHPASGPEAIDQNADHHPIWSWALSVTAPRTDDVQQAAGWLCGLHAEGVALANFRYGEFDLYRLVDECRREVAAGGAQREGRGRSAPAGSVPRPRQHPAVRGIRAYFRRFSHMSTRTELPASLHRLVTYALFVWTTCIF